MFVLTIEIYSWTILITSVLHTFCSEVLSSYLNILHNRKGIIRCTTKHATLVLEFLGQQSIWIKVLRILGTPCIICQKKYLFTSNLKVQISWFWFLWNLAFLKSFKIQALSSYLVSFLPAYKMFSSHGKSLSWSLKTPTKKIRLYASIISHYLSFLPPFVLVINWSSFILYSIWKVLQLWILADTETF